VSELRPSLEEYTVYLGLWNVNKLYDLIWVSSSLVYITSSQVNNGVDESKFLFGISYENNLQTCIEMFGISYSVNS
jgi:hypothetical protein